MDTTMFEMPPAAEACYRVIGPCIHEWELRNLVKLVVDELHPHHIVELGTWKGGFAALFSHICTGLMVSVDKYPQELTGAIEAGTDRLEFVTGDSQNPGTVRAVLKMLDCPIDLLYIDAAHEYNDVKNDFNQWSPHVRPGGWIVLHDIDPDHVPPCNVSMFWKELVGRKWEFIATSEIICYKGTLPRNGGIGIIEMLA